MEPGNPQGNFTSGSFGPVTSARDPRIGQMSRKFFTRFDPRIPLPVD
jgi:hypothetical protein